MPCRPCIADTEPLAQIDGHSILVQERIPGVGLNVAWRYLSPDQKHSFKQQIRAVLRKLHEIQPGSTDTKVPRSYVVPDPDPVANRGIQTLERDIIFTEHADDPDVGFVHMDQPQSTASSAAATAPSPSPTGRWRGFSAGPRPSTYTGASGARGGKTTST